ncbi:hypothetical protein BCR41DRAFT_425991 [Lobosporangium transversale]|uniref:Crinkler effector protein N-terminal domain-containing protein n=1 Tax=Lobosporangium transversale TaxID=64571 RepID=A0A1Y2GAH7_9FUNG|nr:hypothetical protein BCR41DRAFT_425991 [Lobosporangium transversale]ORZ04326.1 hypothetical protein BCR41DRAFT_425991 [Lobosporangium transversale]|eukprot:XP_021876484.1 hypothetical protein BCR41DRAFT_425991 [Lobosporangium transversale]
MSRISKSTTDNIKSSEPTKLKLFCIVEGEPAFSVNINSDQTIDDLKDAIKAKKPGLDHVAANLLTLKLISGGATKEGIRKLSKGSLKVLDNEFENSILTFLTGQQIISFTLLLKDRDQLENNEGDRSSSKRTKLDEDNLMKAISAAGLAQKAIINGDPNLSVLTKIDMISSPLGIKIPVLMVRDLYVRSAFKELYDTIVKSFYINGDNREPATKIVVTGTAEDFMPFLNLPSTWFLVDSSPKPELLLVRTIFSVSPKAFLSKVEAFQKVPDGFMEHLYDLIGGVPRYVLEAPQEELRKYSAEDRCKEKVRAKAEKRALGRIQQALDNLQDPMKILQHFEQAKDSLCYSSHLLHRYPTEDHEGFQLVWASNYIMEKVYDAADDNTWNEILNRLANSKVGVDRGAMFELYMRCILRIGNRCFQAKNLDDNTEITIDIKASPDVKWFNTLECYKDKMQGSLWIPNSKTFAYVDMLITPNYLLQVTTSKDHGIKSKPFKVLLKSMRKNKWIHSSKEVAFIFVVPQDMVEEFKEQAYRTGADRVDPKPTNKLKNIKQYVLAVDLQDELRRCRKKASQADNPNESRIVNQ